MTPDQKIQVFKKTRLIAAQTLKQVLEEVLLANSKISELEFKDKWLEKLRQNPDIFPGGWYDPPESGVAVLFGSKNNLQRVNMGSLRNQKFWPQNNIFLDKNDGIAYFFASPVDKKTGIIGDFGLNIYFGSRTEIKDYLKTCFEIDKQISDFIKVGTRFGEIAGFTQSILEQKGMVNNVISLTDPQGANIGHTIPGIIKDFRPDEKELLDNAISNWDDFKNLISQKRIFVNTKESFEVVAGMVITIEPRPTVLENPEIPMCSFHTTTIIDEKGKSEFFTGFDEIFKLSGMDYL